MSGGSQRGRLGTMTAMPSLDDESYLDFVEGLRKFTLRQLNPRAATALRAAVGDRPIATDRQSRAQLADLAERIPVVAARDSLLRTTQGMNWRRVTEAYEPYRDELIADIDGPDDGRLILDPDFVTPDYYDEVEFHRQPGSYHGDELGGHVYHYGTKVFHLGANDLDEAKIARADEVPEPEDGHVARVLDIGCSIGQVTCGFADRWPDAEVWGVDLAAPLLRYGHARARRLGADVTFAQVDARTLDRFEDESFDVVYMGTLLHEMPLDDGRRALAAARRVLRPGGVFVLHDMLQPSDPPDAWAVYDRGFDTDHNREPYAFDFVYSNVDADVRELYPSVESASTRTTTWICRA
ncbi:methyltransferase family protein [Ilumatobacter fluminis]|uniref:Methyltransferase family protein n=1 Tax=Ilumatobacter fluminis TaxID=467091 RepID=A0A4R7I519_9ACTN|nr:class I SAM-dependent methyltransferase [Ilumatobacter fluminis]TDT18334.1 methyltransferase family protein [Ilumatobacter fluminis]